jgi:hypothetical protein
MKDNFGKFLDRPPESLSADPTAATVRGAEGGKVQVLASRFTLEEEYDHVVFMLQNVAAMEWTVKFETLRAALAETTAQVRVPVSLLSSFVRRIEQGVNDDTLRDLAHKAIRQLGRIELTYDRVLASYGAQSLPNRRDALVDVKLVIDHILSDLPGLERQTVEFSDESPGEVFVDPYRLLFALNSMLAYVLRSRSGNARIHIEARRRTKTVEISMTCAIPSAPPVQDLAALVETTRSEIALGKDVLIRMAEDAGGGFELRREKDGRERLCLKLAKPDKARTKVS